MRLTDLHPRFVGAGGSGIFQTVDGVLVPAPPRQGIGLLFDCPCPTCTAQRTGDPDADHQLQHFIPFANPIDGGPPFETTRPLWTRVGDTIDTLQLTPSILSDPAKGGCGWHGYIGLTIPGEVTTC